MKVRTFKSWAVVFVFVLALCQARAQNGENAYVSSAAASQPASSPTPAPDDEAPITTITKRVNEVNVFFTATDKHGKFVKHLNKSDFQVLDDHKPPQSIVDFRSETDLPLRVGLLVDSSGSVTSRFGFEQQAATQFLTQILRPGFDKAFVIGFNTKSQLTQDYTDNVGSLSKGIERLQPGGGTALYDAIFHACHNKLLNLSHDQPIRKALIVLSDGEDNQSYVSLQQAIAMAQRAEVMIYAISTDDSGLVMRGDGVLEQLAEATGGRAFFPFKMKDITKSFGAIEDELRSQYIVAYRPAEFETDGRYRSIEIIAANKNLHVRSRKGYYAPRQ
jgi:Ca-activated chloride channel homolog